MADEPEPKKPVVARLVTPKPTEGDYEVVEPKPKAKFDEDDDDEDYDRPRRRRRRRDDDEEEEGDATGGLIPYKNAMALLAYYIGIFGIFLPVIGGIVPIIMGFKGLGYAKKHPKARGQVHAIVGIICGFMSASLWLAAIVWVVVLIKTK